MLTPAKPVPIRLITNHGGRMLKSIYLLRMTLVFVLVFFSVGSQAQHSWNNYHWARTSTAFTLQVVDSVTVDWDYQLNESLAQWSSSSVLSTAIISSDASTKARKRCRMVKGQMRVCSAAYGQNGWLGMATIGLDVNGHIDRGTAKVNDSYDWYWTFEEKNHVMCQEIGHIFGLGHTSTDGSSQQTCMDYSTNPASQWPNQHDYDQLIAMYGHLDSYNSYDDGTGDSDGDSGACKAPPGKGCNKNGADVPPMGVRVVRGPSHEIWVAAREDGGLWIHHIRLAPKKR